MANSRNSFPHNAVHYFVSYYDYYQPEAYIPQRDIYIEKDASINEEIDRLRLAATSALVSRRDVIVVASVSCIYGLGSPDDYRAMMVGAAPRAADRPRRNAPQADRRAIRAERHRISAQEISRPRRLRRSLALVRAICLSHRVLGRRGRAAVAHQSHQRRNRSIGKEQLFIYPAKHFVLPEERIAAASTRSSKNWKSGSNMLQRSGKLLEAQRLNARTRFDLEMMQEVGYCPGIENYSRPLERTAARFDSRHAVQFLSRRLFAVRRRIACHGSAGSRHVQRRFQPQDRRSSSMASACPVRWTIGR